MSPVPVYARHTLVATQVVFFACVVGCVLVDPSNQAELYGISYYGVHAPTLPLVAIGYGVGALGMWRTASYLSSLDVSAFVAPGLRVVALALPLELLTPFNHGSFFNWTHMAIGIVIGVTQMVTGTLLALRQPRPATFFVFLVQLIGGLLAAASLPDWGFNHMLEGEVIFEVGFSWCLVMWTYVAPAKKESWANL
jgi:hypothetical protein